MNGEILVFANTPKRMSNNREAYEMKTKLLFGLLIVALLVATPDAGARWRQSHNRIPALSRVRH